MLTWTMKWFIALGVHAPYVSCDAWVWGGSSLPLVSSFGGGWMKKGRVSEEGAPKTTDSL